MGFCKLLFMWMCSFILWNIRFASPGKKFGGLKRVVRVGSHRDFKQIPLATAPHQIFQPVKFFAQGTQT